MKKDIRLITFDLDETLLNSDKTLSAENRQTLIKAAEAGIEIVPATGRIFFGLPDFIRSLPLHYAIFANGAEVMDMRTGRCLYQAYLSNARALELMRFLDTQPVVYDCYLDGTAYMTQDFLDSIERYISTPIYVKMVSSMRTGVPNLPEYVRKRGLPLQKAQAFLPDRAYKQVLMGLLEEKFPDLSITSSIPDNIEINLKSANKGAALLALCDHLNLPYEQSMSFGDGLNDISMIKAAGLGVAMANAHPDVLKAADYVTLTNNEAGVAAAIRKFCF